MGEPTDKGAIGIDYNDPVADPSAFVLTVDYGSLGDTHRVQLSSEISRAELSGRLMGLAQRLMSTVGANAEKPEEPEEVLDEEVLGEEATGDEVTGDDNVVNLTDETVGEVTGDAQNNPEDVVAAQ